jgi:hypothetical protein
MGSPIRKSPDHGLLASPRGLSQLATSFFACLRQGIPTHALSSLTIKFTHNTEQTYSLHAQRRISFARRGAFVYAHQYSVVKERLGIHCHEFTRMDTNKNFLLFVCIRVHSWPQTSGGPG